MQILWTLCIQSNVVKRIWLFVGLHRPQPAVHVATASASRRNEWHAPGSTGHGTVPTMPGTPQNVFQYAPYVGSARLQYLYLSFLCDLVLQFLSNLNEKCLEENGPMPNFFFSRILSSLSSLSLTKWITWEVERWQDNYPKKLFSLELQSSTWKTQPSTIKRLAKALLFPIEAVYRFIIIKLFI